MGEKDKARQAMKRAKVPILPGSDGIIESEGAALEWARTVGYPVILKASAGGGGRGMRIVRTKDELPGLYQAASSEAANAFGNGSIQRRHQKLIEEAPSLQVTAKMREEIGKTLRRSLGNIGYQNAGTVEFLMDEDGSLHFIEI